MELGLLGIWFHMDAYRYANSQTTTMQIAGAYIGTVVGAGFASGQETLRFFSMHGLNGFWALALATFLFIFYGVVLLQLGHILCARSHLEVIRAVAGRYLGGVIDVFITVSLVAALTVMAAGSGAAIQAQFGVPSIIGSAGIIVFSLATVLFGITGVVSAISAVAPFLVGGTVLISVFVVRMYVVNYTWSAIPMAANTWWPMSAISYVSYNLILTLGVLAPLGAMGSPSTLRNGAIVGGIGLGISALAVNMAILTQVPQAVMQEIPMLYVVGKILIKAPLAYTVLLLAEIYTTAVANMYGFAARLAVPGTARFTWVTFLVGGVALAGSRVGFAKLVNTLYSAMGYMGLIVLITLTVWWLRHNLNYSWSK